MFKNRQQKALCLHSFKNLWSVKPDYPLKVRVNDAAFSQTEDEFHCRLDWKGSRRAEN